jgi:hypothetical protein
MSDIASEFSMKFIDAAGIARSGYLVPLDTLAIQLANAVQAVAAQDGHPETRTPSWAATVATRLQHTAAPVFERQQPLNPDVVTAIRLAVLSLAAEADSLGPHELGDTFREIAAGVTLLERRASGDHPATEMILLAID